MDATTIHACKTLQGNSVRRVSFFVAVLTFAMLIPPAAVAVPITFGFSGTVDVVEFDTGTPTEFVAGDTFSGTYTFESAVSDNNTSPNNGYYLNSILSASITVGSYSVTAGPGGNILVRNNVPAQDIYVVEINTYAPTGPDVLGLTLDGFELTLSDSSGTAFTNDSFLLVPPDLADFQSKELELEFADSQTHSSFGLVEATLESLVLIPQSPEVTPEPSTLLLALFGLALLPRRRRR